MLAENVLSSRKIVYAYIQTQMKNGALLPGSVLDLKLISNKLGISNTPLRDALIKLEAEGVLTIHPRSKVVVNSLEIEDFPYLYAMMGTIEYTAISNGLDLYTQEETERLIELNRRMGEAIEEGEIVLYDKFHYAFHAIFFEVTPNIFAERILAPIKNRLWDFPRKNFHKKWYENAINEHSLIIENIKNKDCNALYQNLVKTHWGFEYNQEHILKEYNWFFLDDKKQLKSSVKTK